MGQQVLQNSLIQPLYGPISPLKDPLKLKGTSEFPKSHKSPGPGLPRPPEKPEPGLPKPISFLDKGPLKCDIEPQYGMAISEAISRSSKVPKTVASKGHHVGYFGGPGAQSFALIAPPPLIGKM